MKVKLDALGTLFVTAETELESYALERWMEKYVSHESVLQVNTIHSIPSLKDKDAPDCSK